MKILDVTGKKCPLPLIETKKALNTLEQGESLKVVTDNETAKNNVTRFLNDNNIKSQWEKNDQVYEIMINYQDSDLENIRAEAYCETDNSGDQGFVVVFSKNYLGEGSEELGKILINGYLETLIADEKYPQKMMFLNSGALMTIKGSPQEEVLKEFEEAGVEILVCGTCLDFYKMTDQLAVGKISNMLEIQDAMIGAGKVLNI